MLPIRRPHLLSFLTPLALCLGLAACGDKDSDSGTDTAAEATTAACQLALDLGDCGACYDGIVTCTYGDASVTEGSCGDCQARAGLYNQLCEAGIEDSEEDILAGLECSEPVPE